jgi:S-adenosylmethionine/arginine decarboxylase-like enzyme
MLLFDKVAKILEMTILKEVQLQPEKLDSAQFQDDGGISAFAIISTIRIAIHCWPLRNFVSMGIFLV